LSQCLPGRPNPVRQQFWYNPGTAPLTPELDWAKRSITLGLRYTATGAVFQTVEIPFAELSGSAPASTEASCWPERELPLWRTIPMGPAFYGFIALLIGVLMSCWACCRKTAPKQKTN
jgi:hypothetical protein